MDTVVVTGATGFIGKALTKKLLQGGKTVYAVIRNKDKIIELEQYGDLSPVVTDLENISRLNTLIQDDDIDVFYHLANYARYPEDNQNYHAQLKNTELICDTLTEAIKLNCKKYVLIGTSYQYQKNNNDSNQEYRACSIYGSARFSAQVMCETIAHLNKIKFNTILLTNCFGVGDYSSRSTNSIIRTLLSGESPKLIEGNNKHDWIYIDDLIDGLIAVGEAGKDFKTYYVGNRQLKTFREIIECVRDIINPDIDLKFGTYSDSAYIDYSLIDLDALYIDTGFECKSDFNQSIFKTMEWIKFLDR